MVKTVQEYNCEKAKVAGVKAAITRHCKTLDDFCISLEKLMVRPKEEIRTKTARKKAQDINNIKIVIEERQDDLTLKGDNLMEVIAEMKPEETILKDLEKMVEQVQTELEQYTTMYEQLQNKHADTLEKVETLLEPEKPERAIPQPEPNRTTNCNRFMSCPELKPTFLNQDSSMIDINQWCSQLVNYLNMSYSRNPPETGVSVHLGPLMHSSWIQAFDSQNLEEKTLTEIIELVKKEGRMRMPVHQRRIQLMKAKRNQTRHTEFIFTLEKLMSVAEFETMTKEQYILHLFAETADSTMSKLALDILSSTSPNLAELRNKVTEVENAIWYKGTQGLSKAATYIAGRYCETCKSKSHNTDDCWGKCSVCKGFGHKAEFCRHNPINREGAKGIANTATVVIKKKKKKKTGKAAVDKTTDSASNTEVEEILEPIESEGESEEDSPKHGSNRSNRVGLPNMAKRTLLKKTGLNSYLSTMDEKDSQIWGEGVFKALRAKSARSTDNPIVKGTMWSNRNGGRSTDADAIMDSGCTHPLITETITDALRMKITPLTRNLESIWKESCYSGNRPDLPGV
jgi:hypothetical protein